MNGGRDPGQADGSHARPPYGGIPARRPRRGRPRPRRTDTATTADPTGRADHLRRPARPARRAPSAAQPPRPATRRSPERSR
ncbi:hypothetical protein KPATCC21470_0147 [Kitasatospora purpeofusca]